MKIWIEHTARILAACHVDVKLYLTVRRKTCLELAIYLAEVSLESFFLFESYFSFQVT